MNSRWMILLVVVLAGCSDGIKYGAVCNKELSAVNFSKSESITFIRGAYGSGFSLLTKGCDFLVPMDLAGMSTETFVPLNDLMLEMIAAQDGQKGYGVFEAECECDYDHKTGVVHVKKMSKVRLHSGASGG